MSQCPSSKGSVCLSVLAVRGLYVSIPAVRGLYVSVLAVRGLYVSVSQQ